MFLKSQPTAYFLIVLYVYLLSVVGQDKFEVNFIVVNKSSKEEDTGLETWRINNSENVGGCVSSSSAQTFQLTSFTRLT